MKIPTTLKLIIAALVLTPASSFSAENSADQPAQKPEVRNNISASYEAFSLPIVKAGELQRKGMTDDDLYKELVSVGKLERMLVLQTKSGQRALIGNVSEFRYPVDFNLSLHPVPQPMKGKSDDKKKPTTATPASLVPQAFEKRDLGDTIEVEGSFSPEDNSVEFQIMVSHVAMTKKEKWGQGPGEFAQPEFEIQKLNTNCTALVGHPRFLGTLNPPFENGVATRTEQNVWFCFITATVAQKDAVPQKKSPR